VTRVRVRRSLAVDCHATLNLPLPAISVWGQIRDFHRFASQEFFHDNIRIEGEIPRQGAAIQMTHRFFLFATERKGKILYWREGEGYSFSDLSLSGCRKGFPHVFTYRIEPQGETQTLLHIEVRGKWTAKIPRWIAWFWLRWVFRQVVVSVENDLLEYRIWRQKRNKSASQKV
jgi:hypothetical protein